VLPKFGQPLKARFNPFLDSAGCTIVMRRQPSLKSNFSEDQTLFLETLPRNRLHFLQASFAGRQISLPSKSGELTSSRPAQRFGERQDYFSQCGPFVMRDFTGNAFQRSHTMLYRASNVRFRSSAQIGASFFYLSFCSS